MHGIYRSVGTKLNDLFASHVSFKSFVLTLCNPKLV